MAGHALQVASRLHPGRHVALEGEGQFSIAVRVDDAVLIRFPRHELGAHQLQREVHLLEILRPACDTTLPEIDDVSLDDEIGRAYVAHRFIPGVVITADTIAEWPASLVLTVGAKIGRFLAELHSVTHEAESAGLVRQTVREFASTLRADFDALLTSRATPAARVRVQAAIAALSDVPEEPAVLCHTDLGGNILFDERTGDIAVIDFGDCLITHPAFDLASLSVLGDAFVDACAAVSPVLQGAVIHAAPIRGTFGVQDALNAAKQQDWAYVDEILDGYS